MKTITESKEFTMYRYTCTTMIPVNALIHVSGTAKKYDNHGSCTC